MGEIEWPFLGSEALSSKALPERAMRTFYEAVYRDVYVPRGVELSAAERARAAWLWSKRRGVVAGSSAAALLGTKWIPPGEPAEVIHGNRRPPPLVVVHTDVLLPDEITEVRGVTVTTAPRTAYDLARRMTSTLRTVQRVDALMNATDVKVVEVEAIAAAHRGSPGLAALRQVLTLVDGGAESPQETRTRLLLVEAGLPRPQTQVVVRDDFGGFVARLDLGYREYRVAVEYDGAQHWTDAAQRARDIDRQAALRELGWFVIRVSSDMLRHRARTIVNQVEMALRAAGWKH